MSRRVAQPPVNPSARDLENRDGWRGLVFALAALALILCGARHMTGVDTLSGESAHEIQLSKAFSSGGLQYSDPAALPNPSILNDPNKSAAAFEQLQKRDRKLDKLKYRVDTGASAPCPT